MEREDMVSSLGLRLGPAVKMFDRIQKLQNKVFQANQLWNSAHRETTPERDFRDLNYDEIFWSQSVIQFKFGDNLDAIASAAEVMLAAS